MNVNFLLSAEEGNRNNRSSQGKSMSEEKNHEENERSHIAREKELPEKEIPFQNSSSFEVDSTSSLQLNRQKVKSSRSLHLLPRTGVTYSQELSRTEPIRVGLSRSTFNGAASKRPHRCSFCDKSFLKLEQLRRHDRQVHLNHRPFVCTVCDVSFSTKQNMQVHMSTRKHQQSLETLRTVGQAHFLEQGRK